MNGHEVYYIIPEGVKVLDVKYRETGYNTDLAALSIVTTRSTTSFGNVLPAPYT